MDIVGYAKSHPLQTGTIAVAGVLIIWLLVPSGEASSGASTAVATGPSPDAQLSAQLSLAQLQATSNQQINQMSGELALAKENNSAQLAALRMQIEGQNLSTAAEFDYLSTRDKLTSITDLSNIRANLDINSQTIDSQKSVALAGIGAQVQIASGQNQVAIAQSDNNRWIAQMLGDIQKQQITTGGQVAIAQIQGNTTVAKINADTQKQGNLLGFLGGVLLPF